MSEIKTAHYDPLELVHPETTGFVYDPDQPLPTIDISPVKSAGVVGFSTLTGKPLLVGLGAAFLLWRFL